MKKRETGGEDLWQWAEKTAGQATVAPGESGARESAGITRHLRSLLLSLGRKLRRTSLRRG